MLKKKLGTEAIESSGKLSNYFKISSTLIIPESVKEIGQYAFWDCSRAIIILKKPESEFKYVGSCAFDYCRDVKEETRN